GSSDLASDLPWSGTKARRRRVINALARRSLGKVGLGRSVHAPSAPSWSAREEWRRAAAHDTRKCMSEAGDGVPQDQFGLLGTELEKKFRVDRVVAEGGFGIVYAG